MFSQSLGLGVSLFLRSPSFLGRKRERVRGGRATKWHHVYSVRGTSRPSLVSPVVVVEARTVVRVRLEHVLLHRTPALARYEGAEGAVGRRALLVLYAPGNMR